MSVKYHKEKVVKDLDSILGTLERKLSESDLLENETCNVCNEPIDGEVCTAFGKMWHPKHFVCDMCKTELWTKNYYEKDGKPYCEKDYHQIFVTKCFACKEPVINVRFVFF